MYTPRSVVSSAMVATPDTDVKEEAHEGIIAKVSANPMKACGGCHTSYAEQSQGSIHRLLDGYQTVLKHRGGDFTDPDIHYGVRQPLHHLPC